MVLSKGCVHCTVYLAGAQYRTLNCTHTRAQVSEKLFAFLINNTGVTFPNLVLPVKYNLFANYRRGVNKQSAIIFWVTPSEAIFVEQNREAIKIGVNLNEPKHC